jgi:hypothetical protein
MDSSTTAINPLTTTGAVSHPQELRLGTAGVEEPLADAEIAEAQKNKWLRKQAAGAAHAHELERDVRVLKYEARKKVYGPIDAPHLLGPEPLSFGRYLRALEVRDWIIRQKSSHAMKMYEDLLLEKRLDETDADGANAILMRVVKRYAADLPEGFRYWQRTKNVIWKPFVGLLIAREDNLKARRGEEEKHTRKNHRAEKEKVRLATRNSPAAARERRQAKVLKLRAKATKLRSLAAYKQSKARAWLAQVETLNALAAQRDADAAQIEREPVEPKHVDQESRPE